MYDLRHLTIFAQAARSGSFTVAAQILKCTPGAVSKSVARLEQDIGVRLFNRTTRQLGLTKEGFAYYDAVCRSLDELQRAEDVVSNALDKIEGVVRIALGGSFGKTQILPSLLQLLNRHRGLDFEIACSDDVGDLVGNGFDLSIQCGVPQDSRYICRRLFRYSLKLVASAGYVERYGAISHPSELLQRDCVNVRHGDVTCGWRFTPSSGPARSAVEIVPRSRITVIENMDAATSAVLGGLGPSVLAVHAAQPHLDSGELVEMLPHWNVEAALDGDNEIYLVYPHRDYLPLRIRATIDFLVDRFCVSSTPIHTLKSRSLMQNEKAMVSGT